MAELQGRILSIPNLLTLSRIVLTPFIVYAMMRGEPVLALILMGVAGLTDMLDGAIARLFHQKSTVGAYMDPIADKLMLISSIVALFLLDRIPLAIFLAVVFRDLIIIVGAIAFELVTRKLKMEPTWTSKFTTFFQIMLVLVVLADSAWSIPQPLVTITEWLTFLFTVISGMQYMVVWMKKAVVEEGS